MATELQYSILRSSYDEEQRRYSELNERGKVYLTICTFFLGGSAWKLDAGFAAASVLEKWLYVAAVGAFSGSFLGLVVSFGIYKYAGLVDPARHIESLGESVPDDLDFLDQRIVDLAAAYSVNSARNDRRARWLQASSTLMFVGVVLFFVYVFQVVWP